MQPRQGRPVRRQALILHARESGSGAALVLLHGLFGNARNLASLQASLARTHRVVALDLRNHGASPHGAHMDYATMAADVVETLSLLGLERYAVLGHSMGGKVAMRLALDQPARVSRLVVADIAPVAYRGAFAAHATAMRALCLTPGLTRAQADLMLVEAVPDGAVRAFLLSNLTLGAQPAWRIGLAEIAAALPDLLEWPASDRRFAGPTLFLSGALSDYVLPVHVPLIHRLFPAAEFAQVPQAGHWLHADNPAAFLEAVSAFLDR